VPGTEKVNLRFQQGARFSKAFLMVNNDGSPKDLSGYSARFQVRATRDAALPVVDASTANGKVAIDSLNGLITVTIGAVEMTAMTWRSGVWDLEVYNSTENVYRPFEGFASLSLEVTR